MNPDVARAAITPETALVAAMRVNNEIGVIQPVDALAMMAHDVGAPFLCESRNELRVFAQRIAFAILVAGVCFLLIPLQYSAVRPQPSDWTGAIFRFLHFFDQPYNLLPSLHITFRTILAAFYAKHTKGVMRLASHVWFVLIGFSTLLTYQHHIVDVVGGFVLAAICFYLFREENERLS